ncbi:hypothetical protein HanRHA438_Chr12g0564611 [Helianthus annuus]|uniref:Uncharacterized protein n=1 Tax=Helianthus annuus TaxID=4232 RepID=A0A9K3MX25_HELAN|nr:hypothetical protein HanXRQr2_Chr12g0553311 [Helianthus annuus]KAJ0490269.1 hypothetical protein HanHA300_Chr12g0453521 [Helianthus annuus]KAJ0494420.1 hypothetical protein HanIR_Chr12g0597281 [Helianthus annuus]KAJ0506186.1 hypothetical protein HanHA89_Chr12g0479101 [Helianthus annuus]KAJ0675858.1 hypothetical protein HanLR1_Chr12g0456011 [Helianthus annuus]
MKEHQIVDQILPSLKDSYWKGHVGLGVRCAKGMKISPSSFNIEIVISQDSDLASSPSCLYFVSAVVLRSVLSPLNWLKVAGHGG